MSPLLSAGLFLFLFTLKNVSGYLVSRMQLRSVYGVASRISKDNLSAYLSGSFTEYVDTDSSVHIRRIGQQPIEFVHYVLRGLQQIIGQGVLILITIAAVLWYNPVLFPLLLIILLPPLLIAAMVMKRKLNRIRQHARTTSEKNLQYLHESIAGWIESSVYDRQDFFSGRYQAYQQKLNGFLADQQVIQQMPARLMEVFAVFGLFLLVLINMNTGGSSLAITMMGAFMAAAYKIIPGIVKILNSTGQVKTYDFITEALLKQKSPGKGNAVTVPPIATVRLDNISFGYEERLIKDFSLALQSGDLAAVTGLSGTGKTTLINLLLGFVEPHEGAVIINDAMTDRRLYRSRIAYVRQQPFFIHDTLEKNIALEERPDEEKISAVIETTGIKHIMREAGYGTMITENGKNFSGGQRQRIMLARALYKDFDLLLADEPFSELDEAAQNNMLRSLGTIAEQGKIVLLITHDKAALSFCNKKFNLS